MEILHTDDFVRALEKLPLEIQELNALQEERFYINWLDPRLHLKKLRGERGVFSYRITRRYRGFFYLQRPDRAIFFDIDHRKDAYR
ncbi:MAG: hypothetical protein AAB416_02070 [Patescibacteria group bacterium]